MSQDESDEFCTRLADRLREMCLRRDDAAGGCGPQKAFKHTDMIWEMQTQARRHDREFLEDVLRLVAIYWSYGTNNTKRILENFRGTPQLKQRLLDMIRVYDMADSVGQYQSKPTLSRIAEAFPHISLVMANEINADPALGLKLRVTDRDLGSRVHYLFKLSCFPSLIYIDSSAKAQSCLLLFNLCYAKAIANIAPDKNIVSAFAHSCKFSTDMMEQRLAPRQSRLRFTEHIEAIAPSADLMYRVWITLFGERMVPLNEVTAVTLLHEKALRSQPLYLISWKKLLVD